MCRAFGVHHFFGPPCTYYKPGGKLTFLSGKASQPQSITVLWQYEIILFGDRDVCNLLYS